MIYETNNDDPPEFLLNNPFLNRFPSVKDSVESNVVSIGDNLNQEESVHKVAPKEKCFDIISLPDRDDYLGSWKMIINNFEESYENNQFQIKSQSARIIDFKKKEDPKIINTVNLKENNPNTIKVFFSENKSDEENSKIGIKIKDSYGNEIQPVSEKKNKFYQTLYENIKNSRTNNNLEEIQKNFEMEIQPKDALIALNESFTNSKSSVDNFPIVNSDEDDDDYNNNSPLNALKKRDSLNDNKSKFGASTKRAYNRKNLKRNSLFSKFDKNSKNSKTLQKKKTNNFMTEKEKKENSEQIKFDITITREIWVSLRTTPIFSIAPEILDNIQALGFEIRFIEDLLMMHKKENELVEKNKEEEQNQFKKKSVLNNMRFSKFNALDQKKFKNLNEKEIPTDIKEYNLDYQKNTSFLSFNFNNIETVALMNKFRENKVDHELKITRYYNVFPHEFLQKKSIQIIINRNKCIHFK